MGLIKYLSLAYVLLVYVTVVRLEDPCTSHAASCEECLSQNKANSTTNCSYVVDTGVSKNWECVGNYTGTQSAHDVITNLTQCATIDPTTTTTEEPETTTTPPTTTTTNGTTTTEKPTTTTPDPSTTTTTKPSNSTTEAPKPAPSGDNSGFSFGSFVGGIVLTLSAAGLSYMGWRFYKSRIAYRQFQ